MLNDTARLPATQSLAQLAARQGGNEVIAHTKRSRGAIFHEDIEEHKDSISQVRLAL
jgi:hypothetical protein